MKRLFTVIALAFFALPSFAQGWKYDINFVQASDNSHTYLGVLDERDHSYFLQLNDGNLQVREYLPNGSSGFVKTIISSNAPTLGFQGHNAGGLAVDDSHVFVTAEFHPTNTTITGQTNIQVVDKLNPGSSLVTVASIVGDFFCTDLKINDGFLYVYGYGQSQTPHAVQFIGGGNSISVNLGASERAVIAKFQLNGYAASSATALWAKRVFQQGTSHSSVMGFDDQNGIYLAGSATNGAQINGINTTVNAPTGSSVATIVKFNSNGNADASYTPIVTSTSNSVSTLGGTEEVDDMKIVIAEQAIYSTVRSQIRKHTLTSPNATWSVTLPQTAVNRLAISSCNEMYVTGTLVVPTSNTSSDESYFTKTLDKYSGNLLTNINSAPYNSLSGSDGEVILIQCDGDKVIAADYNINGAGFAVDYDVNTTFNNPTYPNVTYTDVGSHGTFVGVFDDGAAGELVNDFFLFGQNGRETYTFRCGEPILFDGTACKNETNHFIDLWKESTPGNYAYHGGFGWLGGQANVKNISLMAASQNPAITLTPGNYQIKLAIQNACVGWLEKLVDFTILPGGSGQSTLDASFTLQNTNPHFQNGNLYFDVHTSAAPNPTVVEHKWDVYTYNINGTNTLLSTTGWGPYPNQSFYSLIFSGEGGIEICHSVRDEHGCAGEETVCQQTGIGRRDNVDRKSAKAQAHSIQATSHLKVFPSPATNHVSIQNLAAMQGTIYLRNLSGQLIQEVSIADLTTEQLDISDLAKGLYFIQVTYSNGDSFTEKLIKQ